jgi:hypothetical protein
MHLGIHHSACARMKVRTGHYRIASVTKDARFTVISEATRPTCSCFRDPFAYSFRHETSSEKYTHGSKHLTRVPFPFSSKEVGREGRCLGLAGQSIRSAGKERRRVVALVFRGPQLRNRSGWEGAQTRTPPEYGDHRRGLWTGRFSRIRILASALGPA